MSKKILNGKVVSDKNNKTIVVLVKRRYAHPFFGKVITSSKKYHVHDEKNNFKVGDEVKIIESKPFSKNKRWEVYK
tara:strand:- start:413 stop:640 length:228 start_codon:yes stop_codon:yes gene_type:complete